MPAVLRQLKKKKMTKIYLASQEAADYLKISRSTIYKYKGLIKSYKPNGKNLYFLKDDLDDFLKKGENKTLQEMNDELNESLTSRSNSND